MSDFLLGSTSICLAVVKLVVSFLRVELDYLESVDQPEHFKKRLVLMVK